MPPQREFGGGHFGGWAIGIELVAVGTVITDALDRNVELHIRGKHGR
jgi:hypothetical protein